MKFYIQISPEFQIHLVLTASYQSIRKAFYTVFPFLFIGVTNKIFFQTLPIKTLIVNDILSVHRTCYRLACRSLIKPFGSSPVACEFIPTFYNLEDCLLFDLREFSSLNRVVIQALP